MTAAQTGNVELVRLLLARFSRRPESGA